MIALRTCNEKSMTAAREISFLCQTPNLLSIYLHESLALCTVAQVFLIWNSNFICIIVIIAHVCINKRPKSAERSIAWQQHCYTIGRMSAISSVVTEISTDRELRDSSSIGAYNIYDIHTLGICPGFFLPYANLILIAPSEHEPAPLYNWLPTGITYWLFKMNLLPAESRFH